MYFLLITWSFLQFASAQSDLCQPPSYLKWKTSAEVVTLAELPAQLFVARVVHFSVQQGDKIKLDVRQNFLQKSESAAVCLEDGFEATSDYYVMQGPTVIHHGEPGADVFWQFKVDIEPNDLVVRNQSLRSFKSVNKFLKFSPSKAEFYDLGQQRYGVILRRSTKGSEQKILAIEYGAEAIERKPDSETLNH